MSRDGKTFPLHSHSKSNSSAQDIAEVVLNLFSQFVQAALKIHRMTNALPIIHKSLIKCKSTIIVILHCPKNKFVKKKDFLFLKQQENGFLLAEHHAI